MLYANINHQNAGMAILKPEKVGLGHGIWLEKKEGHFIIM
jgi:hypothetical protein